MEIFRILARLFKTWFWTAPAHDAYVAHSPAEAGADVDKAQGAADAGMMEENDERRAGARGAQEAGSEVGATDEDETGSERRRKVVLGDTAAELPDFSHLVKEPEGAGERTSRSNARGARGADGGVEGADLANIDGAEVDVDAADSGDADSAVDDDDAGSDEVAVEKDVE